MHLPCGDRMLKARLQEDAVLGRCLATSSSVERGELVLEELPFARGPKRDSGIVCLGCYQFLQFGEDGDSLDRCELCDWPLCGSCADDEDVTEHRGECQVFSAARVTFAGNVSDDGVCPQLDCITILRLVRGRSSGAGMMVLGHPYSRGYWVLLGEPGRSVRILVLAAAAHFSQFAG